jgi:hypothetical protein
MAATAAVRKSAKAPSRRELCQELLDIMRKPAISEALSRIDAIKSLLKDLSKVDGKFREEFAGIGYVSASPAAPERVVGEEPILSVEAWQAARQSQRDKLLEQGLVKISPIVKSAYHGRVEAKLHTTPAS